MFVIGVDSSGKVGNPPIFMVACTQQDYYCVKVTASVESKFKAYPDWNAKLIAILIYRACRSLAEQNQLFELDSDFDAKMMSKIACYLQFLFWTLYHTRVFVRFGHRTDSSIISRADTLSKNARVGRIRIAELNPNIEKEFIVVNRARC